MRDYKIQECDEIFYISFKKNKINEHGRRKK